MADFNQSPTGQASIDLDVSTFALTIAETGTSVDTSFAASEVFGATGQLSLTQVESGTFDMYPSYRRPIRLIASTPAT
jgi:hypothetical protein